MAVNSKIITEVFWVSYRNLWVVNVFRKEQSSSSLANPLRYERSSTTCDIR